MDTIAEQYVRLVLALGQHDADYVDAYYGPPGWKKEAAGSRMALDDIGSRAKTLLADLESLHAAEQAHDLAAFRRAHPHGDLGQADNADG